MARSLTKMQKSDDKNTSLRRSSKNFITQLGDNRKTRADSCVRDQTLRSNTKGLLGQDSQGNSSFGESTAMLSCAVVCEAIKELENGKQARKELSFSNKLIQKCLMENKPQMVEELPLERLNERVSLSPPSSTASDYNRPVSQK